MRKRLWNMLRNRSFTLAVVSILLGGITILIPYASPSLLGLRFPVPLEDFFRSAGVAFMLAGTISFGVEELIKFRTRNEFEIQLNKLITKSGDKLSSELLRAIEAHISSLEKRIETLRYEIQSSNIEMIFSRRENGLEAMGQAISNANEFIYIMGISLREFFQLDTSCAKAILEAYSRKNPPRFKVLILNSQSSEALERSKREEGIKDDFTGVDDPEFRVSTLFRETRKTAKNIQIVCPEMQLRIYDRPSLFLLITEKVVFVEPYHYGDRVMGRAHHEQSLYKRVAELVPLIEFRKGEEQGAYEQFLGHFEYVFENANPLDEKNKI